MKDLLVEPVYSIQFQGWLLFKRGTNEVLVKSANWNHSNIRIVENMEAPALFNCWADVLDYLDHDLELYLETTNTKFVEMSKVSFKDTKSCYVDESKTDDIEIDKDAHHISEEKTIEVINYIEARLDKLAQEHLDAAYGGASTHRENILASELLMIREILTGEKAPHWTELNLYLQKRAELGPLY